MSNIKIQDVDQRIQYTATSSQTEFAIPFPFFENSDIVAYQDDTLLILTTDYTLSGAGSPSGGTLTLVTGATAGDIITISGDLPIDRTSIYSATISNLTGSDLNQDFNREVVMMKQIDTTQRILQLQYAPYLEVSQDDTVTKDRWLPLLGASQVWAMNPAGTEIIAVDFDDTADAPADAFYYLGQADGQLINGVNLGALTSGLLKHTVSAGNSVPATAVVDTDYWAPGSALTRTQVPTVDDDVVNKLYADSIASGFNFLKPARAATTANFTSTYDNGTAGIGATLTASSNGAAAQDGVSLSLNDRALFKDQTNTFENGVYYVSQVGDGSNPAIYTRSIDFDTPTEIQQNTLIGVAEGTVNEETLWRQTQDVTTVGTDAISFNQFGINPTNVVTIDGTQTITGDKTFTGTTIFDNLQISGNSLSSNSGAVRIDPLSGQAFTVNTLGGAGMDFNFTGSGNFDLNFGSGKFNINSTTGVDGILDEDDMASDSATDLATQQSIKAYVDNSFTITPWTAYTPTFTGFGTASNVEFWSRRVGDTLEIRGRFTSGTSTATEARITIGYNGTSANVNSSSTVISSIQYCGTVIQSVTSVGSYQTTALIESNVSYMTFGAQSSSDQGLTKVNASGLLASGTVWSMVCFVPVTTWI